MNSKGIYLAKLNTSFLSWLKKYLAWFQSSHLYFGLADPLSRKCSVCAWEWSITSHWSGRSSLKSLQIKSTVEGVKKRESVYIVGGNVNWCSHYGQLFEGSQIKRIKNRAIIKHFWIKYVNHLIDLWRSREGCRITLPLKSLTQHFL